MRIAIVGAGLTGLTAGFRLSQSKHQVTIFEKEGQAGGLAASFQKKTWRWPLENFFHHLFTTDGDARQLISELGLETKLFFKNPQTSIYYQNIIFPFSSPAEILQAPFFSLPEKLRLGLVTAYLKATNNWQALEKTTASNWLARFYGPRPYRILWEPLLAGKFAGQKDLISMAWFWARVKKRSRQLGYLQGGFQVLIDKLLTEIQNHGQNHGQIILNHLEIKNLNVIYHLSKFDRAIITTPADKFFPTQLPPMIGALNLVLELKEKFFPDNTYWLNINDAAFPFVAVVEHTNFVNKKYYGGHHILYVGGYYPQNHPFFKMTKKQILKKFLPYLQKLHPRLSVISYQLSANLYSQPIVPINHSQNLPSFQTAIPHVFLANMQMVYPWDRGINYAIQMGAKVANEVVKNS